MRRALSYALGVHPELEGVVCRHGIGRAVADPCDREPLMTAIRAGDTAGDNLR